MLKANKPKYHAGQALMTDMGNIFTIKAVTKNLYELSGHKIMNSLPIKYIDTAEHIKPATKAGRLLYERFKKATSL